MDAAYSLDPSLDKESLTTPADLGSCVAWLVNAVAGGMAEIVAPHGFTHIDFAVLRLFLEVEEWTTTRMAQVMPLAPSGISRTVSKLVDRGLIRRRRLLSDRRVVILTLTEEGTNLTQYLHQRVRAFDVSLCDGIGEEEMAVLASISSRVMANYETLRRSGAIQVNGRDEHASSR